MRPIGIHWDVIILSWLRAEAFRVFPAKASKPFPGTEFPPFSGQAAVKPGGWMFLSWSGRGMSYLHKGANPNTLIFRRSCSTIRPLEVNSDRALLTSSVVSRIFCSSSHHSAMPSSESRA